MLQTYKLYEMVSFFFKYSQKALQSLPVRATLVFAIVGWKYENMIWILHSPLSQHMQYHGIIAGIVLGMGSANEGWRYIVTSSLIGIPRMIPVIDHIIRWIDSTEKALWRFHKISIGY